MNLFEATELHQQELNRKAKEKRAAEKAAIVEAQKNIFFEVTRFLKNGTTEKDMFHIEPHPELMGDGRYQLYCPCLAPSGRWTKRRFTYTGYKTNIVKIEVKDKQTGEVTVYENPVYKD